MNSKTTWICVAVAGVLFAFIFFVERPLRQQTNAARTTKIFPGFDTNAVTHIEVRRAGQQDIYANRTNQSWTLTRPLVYPAAPAPIENLLQVLANLDWQTHLTAVELQNRPKAQEEFGFAAPTASIVVRNGASILNLLVGTNTPVGEQIYLQVVGDAGAYVVDSEFMKFLPRSANDWRDTALLRLTHSINVVTRSGNKGLAMLRTNDVWRLSAPQQARGDASKIDALLKKTIALQVAKFETDEPVDLEPFGLQTPEMELSLGFDTNILATLQVGRSPTNDPANVFVRLQNHSNIFLVAKETLDSWRSSHTNFVDRHLVGLPLPGIAQIEVRGEDHFVLQRKGDSWTLNTVTNFPVDSDLVNEVLAFLSRAEVEMEKDVVTDFASYGLSPPALQYTLKSGTSSNSVVAQIDFGTNQPGKVFVRRTDEYPDTVNSIQAQEYNRLPQASWQFRDRRIWNFGSNDVASVSIHQQGKDRKIIRNAKGDWSFAPGSQGILNPFSFNESLYRLGELKAVFWVASNEQNPDRFGFTEADHRIVLEVKRDGKMEALSLEFGGFSEFGTRYSAIFLDGVRTIFEFPWPLFFSVQESLSIPSR